MASNYLKIVVRTTLTQPQWEWLRPDAVGSRTNRIGESTDKTRTLFCLAWFVCFDDNEPAELAIAQTAAARVLDNARATIKRTSDVELVAHVSTFRDFKRNPYPVVGETPREWEASNGR